ncbi:Cas10/Cmr2 second palm domain-containing protein [Desulfobacterium sp. N47]|uniref:GGDEF domain-containing protein n=1 Tax=uncultured Desulfobacterium sp. TaxID=201089 RepID=E1YMA8_9BACT|nr:hypothetical protein N47_E47530 [uncultured Desulfobacterium sp.]
MKEKTYLIVMGIPSIKKYVFGTDRLMEIRGASSLLDNLIRHEIEDFLKKCTDIIEVDTVFTGGGSAQFIIKSDEEKLGKYLRDLEGIFINKTGGGIRLIWGKAEYDGSNYQEAMERAHLESESQREEKPFVPTSQLHTGFIRECNSCSKMAGYITVEQNKQRLLCNECYLKLKYNRNAREYLWDDLSKFLQKKHVVVERPDTFEQIGEQCSVRNGYTALIYADGNVMGKIIKQIKDKTQYQFFSKTVEDSIRKACYEAIYETFFESVKERPTILPAEVLLLGGDDLLVYLTAESAFPFAIKLAKKFNEETKRVFANSPFFPELLEGKGLTISLGIAYGKSHTPFSIMLEQAEELLHTAKKKGSQDKNAGIYYAPSYIDYHISTNFNQVSVKESRTAHMKIHGTDGRFIKLYQRPYSLEDAETLLEHAENLKNSNIPGTRLNRLGNAPTMGKVYGTIEFLNLYTRAGDSREAVGKALDSFDCFTHMPWKNEIKDDSTVLVDLIELAGFCKRIN